MTASITFYPELTIFDRCDRCEGPAQMRILFPIISRDLLLCGHHAHKHKPRLLTLDVELQISP
jgi:hypothetical protein